MRLFWGGRRLGYWAAVTVVYLDNAASTRPADEVVSLMGQVARDQFANPAAVHGAGAAAARLLEQAREEVALALGGRPAEVVFTSGGTEANALAVLGAAARSRRRHLVVSAIEHPSVLRNAEHLADASGWSLTLVAPDSAGIIQPEAVAAALRPDTAVVAVMLVNNELGTVQPVAQIARALARMPNETRPHFHVDAVQGFGLVPFRAAQLGADSLAVSGHKVHGPRGAGALWVRAGARLGPLWQGGGQEQGIRSGTENLPAIVGFARATTLALRARTGGVVDQMAALRDRLEARIVEATPGARRTVTVPPEHRAPHICSLSLPGMPAEPLLHALAARGVMVSAGSACAAKLRGPSHVLKAVGVGEDTAVLRFSLSRDTTAAEIDFAADAVAGAVAELGAASFSSSGPGAAGTGGRKVKRHGTG